MFKLKAQAKITVSFSIFETRVQYAKVATQDSTTMTNLILTPSCNHCFRDALEENVQEAHSIDPDLWEDVGLCRGGE